MGGLDGGIFSFFLACVIASYSTCQTKHLDSSHSQACSWLTMLSCVCVAPTGWGSPEIHLVLEAALQTVRFLVLPPISQALLLQPRFFEVPRAELLHVKYESTGINSCFSQWWPTEKVSPYLRWGALHTKNVGLNIKSKLEFLGKNLPQSHVWKTQIIKEY